MTFWCWIWVSSLRTGERVGPTTWGLSGKTWTNERVTITVFGGSPRVRVQGSVVVRVEQRDRRHRGRRGQGGRRGALGMDPVDVRDEGRAVGLPGGLAHDEAAFVHGARSWQDTSTPETWTRWLLTLTSCRVHFLRGTHLPLESRSHFLTIELQIAAEGHLFWWNSESESPRRHAVCLNCMQADAPTSIFIDRDAPGVHRMDSSRGTTCCMPYAFSR